VSRRLLIFLLLAVSCVAWAVNWQSTRERRGDFDVARPLMAGVKFQRIVGMRISSLVRGADVGLERDRSGSWYMVDPVAYRADEGVMELMRQVVENNLALVPPDQELDLAAVGLDPPRAEWIVTERVEDVELTHRLLVGDPDPTGNRVYVLQGGELLLTSSNLATTLDRDFPEYRSRRISQLDPGRVVEVHRAGRIQHDVESDAYDLEFSAYREGASWRLLQPFEAALDPLDVSFVVVGAGRLGFDRYIEEPDVDLGAYGLSQPEMRVELKALGGASEVLFLGRPGVGEAWFCRREGTDDVYRVASRDAVLMTYPLEAMIDKRLTRVASEEVLAVRLESPGGVVRLSREGEGWVVADGEGDGAPAEAVLVRSLLAWVAEVELLPFDDLGSHATVSGEARRLVLEIDGAELGGEIGGVAPGEDGEVVWYRRFGDDVTGRLDAEVLEWLDRPVDTWWSLSLLELDELGVDGLVLTHGDAELGFSRGDRGRWRDGSGREVVDLLPWLDPLLFLRATDRVEEGDAGSLEAAVGVRFELKSGEDRAFLIGAGLGGRVECEIGPARAVLLRQDLHSGLLSLFP